MSLPIVDPVQEVLKQVHPIDDLKQSTRKRGKTWKQSYKLVSFTTPTPVDSPSIQKKFKLQFTYQDTLSKKYHTKVVYFGNQNDYVYTKNKTNRLKKLTKMKNLDNPFNSNYWSSWIMNKYQTMEQGFLELQRHMIQQSLNDSRKMPPKPTPAKKPLVQQFKKAPKLPLNL